MFSASFKGRVVMHACVCVGWGQGEPGWIAGAIVPARNGGLD